VSLRALEADGLATLQAEVGATCHPTVPILGRSSSSDMVVRQTTHGSSVVRYSVPAASSATSSATLLVTYLVIGGRSRSGDRTVSRRLQGCELGAVGALSGPCGGRAV
jgi:hypothetical protein